VIGKSQGVGLDVAHRKTFKRNRNPQPLAPSRDYDPGPQWVPHFWPILPEVGIFERRVKPSTVDSFGSGNWEGHGFSRAGEVPKKNRALAPER
jgi:hypothetical protein